MVGNGIGETSDEAAGSDNDVLAESFLLSSSVFGAGRSESLGNAFQAGGAETVTFQYRDAVSGAISDGTVIYVTTALDGDFDNDGDFDGADFLVWQRTDGTIAGLSAWQDQYSSGTLAAVASVPEPTTTALLAVMSISLLMRCRAPVM